MGTLENPKTYICTDQAPQAIRETCQYVIKDGYLPDTLLGDILAGYRSFFWYPGRYLIPSASRSIVIGPDTVFAGITPITLDPWVIQPTQPDSSVMAVFTNNTDLPETTSANSSQIGYIQTLAGASGIHVSDIALDGYTVLRAVAARDCTFSKIIVHNYRGTYPDGKWCNMGYGNATASVWIYKSCSDITLNDVSIQFSSHHGFAIHSGDNSVLSQNITLNRCRFLYCGCGLLRGEDQTHIDYSRKMMPTTDGYGYVDWSAGADLCENARVKNVNLVDCVCWSAWKAGIYTEPVSTSGPRSGITLTRCISGLSGQRALIAGSNPQITRFMEGEGANFYLQTGVLTDCLSYCGLKAGYTLCSEDIEELNAHGDRITLIDCTDIRSPIGINLEMNATAFITGTGSILIANQTRALRSYGWTNIKFTESRIVTEKPDLPPVLLGAMNREFCGLSAEPKHQAAYAPGGKYDSLTISMSNSLATGMVSGLDAGTPAAEVKSGSRFNGTSMWKPEGALTGVKFTRTEEKPDLEINILQAFGITQKPAIVTPPPVTPVEPDPEPTIPDPVTVDSETEIYLIVETEGKPDRKIKLG